MKISQDTINAIGQKRARFARTLVRRLQCNIQELFENEDITNDYELIRELRDSSQKVSSLSAVELMVAAYSYETDTGKIIA